MKHCWISIVCVAATWLGLATVAFADPGAQVIKLNETAPLVIHGKVTLQEDGEGLQVDGPCDARLDLASLNVNVRDFDLIRLTVKATRGAWLRVSLENYPEPLIISHWYVLDGQRGGFDWRPIWIDLRRPEEIKPPGRKGMDDEQVDPDSRGLRLVGDLIDSRRAKQPRPQRMWVRDVAFVKKAIDLDWNQVDYTLSRTPAGDLVYTYPLTLTNRLDRQVTAALRLEPLQQGQAKAQVVSSVDLPPGRRVTVEAKLTLPAGAAKEAPPLATEWFEVRAEVPALPDSEVTILRSSDPIHLSVTVPLPDSRISLPLLPRPRDLPRSVTLFDEPLARQTVAENPPEALIAQLRAAGRFRDVPQYIATLASAAYLYDSTGDRQFLDIASALLAPLPDIWRRQYQQWQDQDVATISSGILELNTLSLGWRLAGTQRWPYSYGGTSGSAKGGVMSSLFYCFDMIAADLDPVLRQRLINDLIVPAGIHARNHYIGQGNQQCSADAIALYAGLAGRNWPLVAFAYDAEHGLLGQMDWAFDDDGLSLEGHYQTYACRPLVLMTELLRSVGVNLYNQRLYTILQSRGAEAIGSSFNDPIVDYLLEHRFDPSLVADPQRTQGSHLSTSTMLQWKGLQVVMNWGTHIMRGSHDRGALTVRVPRSDRDRKPLAVGGGSYNQSSFGQSIIVVDEQLQNPLPSQVLSYDVTGPVQHVMARSDQHYPGSEITRTFALLGDNVLIVDRVVNDQPRTVDWQLREAGEQLSIPMETRNGSWTQKPDDAVTGRSFGGSITQYDRGQTSQTFTEGDGRLTVLGGEQTQVITWQERRRPFLMLRRNQVRQTVYIAMLSLHHPSIQRLPVTTADGKPSDAVGLKITLDDGKTFNVIVNDGSANQAVRLGQLSTTERFATDFAE